MCIDLGEEALIVYPDQIQPYVYEDPYTVELFAQAIRPNDCVLDLGAHNGYYAVIAGRRVGPLGRVFAFEPEPGNFRTLNRNVRLNHLEAVVTPVNQCVGDKVGTVRLMVIAEGSRSNGLYLHPHMNAQQVLDVPSTDLDSFMPTGTVNVVKLDVEGAEPAALRGMQHLLARSPNVKLFAELHPTMLAGQGRRWEDYLADFESLGFSLQWIDENQRRLKAVDLNEFRKHAQDQWWHTNILAEKRAA